MPVKAVDDGLLEIDGGLDGAAGDEQHPHDGANEACPGDEVLELVLEVLAATRSYCSMVSSSHSQHPA